VGLALLLCGWRLLRGPERPTACWRWTRCTSTSWRWWCCWACAGTALYFEAALLIALLGFVSTVALARYLSRGDVIE
jgi:multicomponent K+:H+ antiporter subunit F